MRAMASEGFFPRGANSELFQMAAKIIFPGRGNNGGVSFYELETKRKTFFYQKVNRKISNFKIQKGTLSPIPTPMLRAEQRFRN